MGRVSLAKLGVLLLVAAVAGICLWFRKATPEPVYHGQPLSYWLAGYDAGNYRALHTNGPAPPTDDEANDAIQHIGTNAIPLLLRMLQQPNPKWSAFVFSTLNRQHLVKIRYAPGNRDFKAYQAFQALGPQASNAVPELIAIFDRHVSPRSQQAVPAILGFIGPGPAGSVPFLLRALHHTNDFVRCNAISALARVHPDVQLALPVLTPLLKDPDAFVRTASARALGAYGPAAQSAFPALLDAWRKETPTTIPTGMMSMTAYGPFVGEEFLSLPGLGFINAGTRDSLREALRALDLEAAYNAGVR